MTNLGKLELRTDNTGDKIVAQAEDLEIRTTHHKNFSDSLKKKNRRWKTASFCLGTSLITTIIWYATCDNRVAPPERSLIAYEVVQENGNVVPVVFQDHAVKRAYVNTIETIASDAGRLRMIPSNYIRRTKTNFSEDVDIPGDTNPFIITQADVDEMRRRYEAVRDAIGEQGIRNLREQGQFDELFRPELFSQTQPQNMPPPQSMRSNKGLNDRIRNYNPRINRRSGHVYRRE